MSQTTTAVKQDTVPAQLESQLWKKVDDRRVKVEKKVMRKLARAGKLSDSMLARSVSRELNKDAKQIRDERDLKYQKRVIQQQSKDKQLQSALQRLTTREYDDLQRQQDEAAGVLDVGDSSFQRAEELDDGNLGVKTQRMSQAEAKAKDREVRRMKDEAFVQRWSKLAALSDETKRLRKLWKAQKRTEQYLQRQEVARAHGVVSKPSAVVKATEHGVVSESTQKVLRDQRQSQQSAGVQGVENNIPTWRIRRDLELPPSRKVTGIVSSPVNGERTFADVVGHELATSDGVVPYHQGDDALLQEITSLPPGKIRDFLDSPHVVFDVSKMMNSPFIIPIRGKFQRAIKMRKEICGRSKRGKPMVQLVCNGAMLILSMLRPRAWLVAPKRAIQRLQELASVFPHNMNYRYPGRSPLEYVGRVPASIQDGSAQDRTLFNFVYQGGVASAPIRVSVETNVLETLANEVVERTSDFPSLSRFLALLIGLGSASSIANASAVVYLYISEQHFVQQVDAWLRRLWGNAVKSWKGMFRYQAGEGEEKNWKDFLFEKKFTEVHQSAFGHALWQLVGSFSVLSLAANSGIFGDVEMVERVMKRFDKLLLQDRKAQYAPIETFMQRAVRLVSVMVERLTEAVKTGNWTDFFSGELTLREWCELVDCLIDDECIRIDIARPGVRETFEKKKRDGRLPRLIVEQVDSDQRGSWLRQLAIKGRGLATRYAEDFQLKAMLTVRIDRAMKVAVALENTQMNGSYRIPPFAMFIPGPAGCGKTMFCHLLHTAIGRAAQYPITDDTMFRVQPNSNFPDAFNPGSWFCFFDDVDSSMAQPTAGTDSHVDLVMKYINPAPLNMEAAAVESKGKLWAQFTVAAYTTNYDNARLVGYTLQPKAFWRRFGYHIKLEVKEEWRPRKELNEIDRTKRIPDDAEVWNITVSKYAPTMTGPGAQLFQNPPYAFPKVFGTVRECMLYLNTEFRAYMEKERGLLERQITDKLRDGCCSLCGLPKGRHIDSDGTYTPCAVLQSRTIAVATLFGALCGVIGLSYYSSPAVWHAWLAKWYYRIVLWCDRFRQRNFFGPLTMAQLEERVRVQEERWAQLWRVGLPSVTALAVAGVALRYWYTTLPEALQGSTIDVHAVSPLFAQRDTWKRVPVSYTRPYVLTKTPTYTFDEFMNAVRERMVLVTWHYKGGTESTCWGCHLNGLVVTVRHPLYNVSLVSHVFDVSPADRRDVVSVTVKKKHEVATFPVTADRCWELPGVDLAFYRVPELVPLKGLDLAATLPRTTQADTKLACDESWLVKGDSTMVGGPGSLRSRFYSPRDRLLSESCLRWEGDFPTESGDCGAIVVARFGNKFCVVGVHHAGVEGGRATSLAIDFHGGLLDEARVFFEHHRVPEIRPANFDDSQLGDKVTFQELPKKSSLAVSLTQEKAPSMVVVGTCQQYANTKIKTRLEKTWFYDDLPREKIDGMVIPTFGGEMREVDGELRWVDPYTVNLESARNKGGEWALWRRAIDDYLNGVDELVGTDRVRPLSDYEVIFGIEGTTVGGTNLNTSAGAPFFCPKKNVMAVDHDAKTVDLSPRLLEQIERIGSVIESGEVYMPLSVHTLKDEVISLEKELKRKVRVFNNLPFAFNFWLKKYFGPILAFFRRHWRFFECAVGMDICSDDINRMLDFLGSNKDKFLKYHAGDRAFFDTGASTEEELAQAALYSELAQIIGYTDDEVDVVYCLMLSCMYMMRVIKGDVFATAFMMPTGYWNTILINCSRNSVQYRYAFYAEAREKHTRFWYVGFREVIKLLVLGDDSVASVKKVVEWFTQLVLAKWLRTVGGDLTSPDKKRELGEWERFEDLSFLKRKFRRIGDLWVAPIEEKTLWKMLAFRMKGELSAMDHHARQISNVLAESWMHGRQFFDEMSLLCLKLVSKHNIMSQMLVVHEFDWYLEKYRSGQLSVWEPLENVPLGDESS